MEKAEDAAAETVEGHFLHPHHPLARISTPDMFQCHGCFNSEYGSRYRCDPCDFDLHESCARCAPTLRSPLHPQHALTLIRKLCGICAKRIAGLGVWYMCADCRMDFHKECLVKDGGVLPGAFVSELHPRHKVLRTILWCNHCRQSLRGLFYACRGCNVDWHPACLLYAEEDLAERRPDVASDHDLLYFFMHPEHKLSPLPAASDPQAADRVCEACAEPLGGERCYGCEPCGYRVHRGCATSVMPAVKDLAVHPGHALHYLRMRGRSCCSVCGEACVAWRYHCPLCNVHVHRRCLKLHK